MKRTTTEYYHNLQTTLPNRIWRDKKERLNLPIKKLATGCAVFVTMIALAGVTFEASARDTAAFAAVGSVDAGTAGQLDVPAVSLPLSDQGYGLSSAPVIVGLPVDEIQIADRRERRDRDGRRDRAGEIRRHETAGIIDLVPGAERGTITQPLLRGTIATTGQEVYFVITDASDQDFAEMFGAIRADSLEEAPEAAVEYAEFINGEWYFFEDPGLVARFDPNTGEALPPVANPNYSPLKRFEWNGEMVTANVPFVKWGDDPGQQLLIDRGGCDPLIRSNPPVAFLRR